MWWKGKEVKQRNRLRLCVSEEISAIIVDHVLIHDLMAEAG